MKRFKIQTLGADNGSGFERGGDFPVESIVLADGSTFTTATQLAREIVETAVAGGPLNVDGTRTDSGARIYDLEIAKVGAHYFVTFAVSEEGCGEQVHAYVATEVI